MISIIVCSKHKILVDSLRDNIEATIGTSYEIICIDNSSNQYNIFQAYNEGVRRAKYEYLCFMHEDIEFETVGWGKNSIEKFSDNRVGMIGVQGCVYFDESTTYWCTSGLRKAHIIQSKGGKDIKIKEEDYPCGNSVVAVDGCWMMMRKSLFDEGIIRWDDETFKGFHMYDMDISFQIITHRYRILINEDLWLNHKSWGNYNESFYAENKKLHNKWDDFMPITSIELNDEVKKIARRAAYHEICRNGKECAKSRMRLSLWPYKIATKLCLLMKKNIW